MDISFGNWVKRRRKALDITQHELAGYVGCSLSLIFKIESGERRPSRQIAELLAGKLDIPDDQRALFLKIARQEKSTISLDTIPPLSQLEPASGSFSKTNLFDNLPLPISSLVGREFELRAIIQQIQDPACRLLTLTGPGGVGKTRLALEVAHQLKNTFNQGVCYVSLAGTSASEFITLAIAESLGVVFSGTSELEAQLFNSLKDRQLLLVLDNLDHLVDGIELLQELVQTAPNVKLLTTSREQLNLRAEWIFEVQGLPVPSIIHFESLETNSAASLFFQRAKQANVNFTPSPDDLPAIIRICQSVEGLPLGLELSATWVNTLSCQEIADEINRGLDILATSKRDTPERHRSIHAVFEYSWNLLSAKEQDVLKKLSVFQGGFKRDAAEKVAGATLPLLSSLLGKSLIRRSEAGRYDQHELIRQFSAMQLREDPQTKTSTLDLHAGYYLELWREREGQLKGAEQWNALHEMIEDIDNFRSAWDTATNRNHYSILYQSFRSFMIVYDLYGWHPKAIKRFEAIIQGLNFKPNVSNQAADILGLALSFQGWFYFRLGKLLEARESFDQGLILLKPLGDQLALADSLTLFSAVLASLGAYEKAEQCVTNGLDAAQAIGDKWRSAHALMMQGGILLGLGKFQEARESSQQALAHFRTLGDARLIAVTLNTLGFISIQMSQFHEAREYLQEGLRLVTPAQDPWSVGTAYGNLGIAESALGSWSEAQELLKKSIPLFAELGMVGDVAFYMTYLGDALLALGEKDGAENNWMDAIHIAGEIQAIPTVLAILVRLAELQADRDDFVYAYKWASQVASHPAARQDSKDRADKLRDALEPNLSVQQLQSIQTSSSLSLLDGFVHELLSQSEDENENK